MKLFYRIKAVKLRKALIRQRAENIRDIRVGRRAARLIKRDLARYSRLGGSDKRAGGEPKAAFVPRALALLPLPLPTARAAAPAEDAGTMTGKMAAILDQISFTRREA
jgi:hypothetical protein